MAAATLGLVPTIAVVSMNTSAQAVGGAVASTTDFAGFPHWYEDNNGTRVDACLDLTDTHCILLATPTFNPGQPLAFPGNFPDEFFYSVVDADKLTTPGCVGDPNSLAANPGKMTVRMALEGAFGGGPAAAGDQMTFGRIRITVRGGLCPNQTYTFQTPYGDFPLTTDANGSIPPNAGTMQAGCPIPTPTSPCDYTAALSSPIITAGILRWDAGADPGYLGGDPAVLHTITGGVNNNSVNVLDSTNAPVAGLSTNLFTVSGRLAGPLLANTDLLDAGPADITVPETTTNTITLTNVSRDAGVTDTLTFQAPTITGPEAGDFAVTNTNCATLSGINSSCTVSISFTPTTTGRRNATLTVPYTGSQHAPFTVPIAGTGVTSGDTPVITLSTPTLSFPNARVGTLTAFKPVTITNDGAKPLQVQSMQLTGPDASQFRIGQDHCTSTGPGVFVQPAATCTFAVAFQPTTTGLKAANVQINANIAGQPATVTLSATGTGGVAKVSTAPNGGIDPANGFPYWYQDEANQRTGACIDPQDPLCVVLADSFYDPAQPMLFPTNFPSEFFYTVATSDNIATPGCGNSAPGKAFIRTAVEGAFGGPTGGPVAGDQITFARTRIVVTSGLCANTDYVFTYPYGQVTLKTDAAGGIRRNAATNNAGCGAGGVVACDFSLALQGETFGEFVKQVNAPAGYLGDPNLLAPITGAPFIDPADNVTPANFLRIDGPDGNNAPQSLLTDQFTVMGKLVGPVIANPSPVLFGGVDVLSGPTAAQTVTFTNDGSSNVTIGATPLTLGGATVADFAITGTTCAAGQVLAPNQSCTAAVTFNPQGNGPRLGILSLNSDAPNSPTPVNLEGTGNAAAGFPAISVRPLTVDFTDVHVGVVSAAESVRASNAGGSALLKIGTNAGGPAVQILTTNVLGGPADTNFVMTDNCTAVNVAPEATCDIRVQFVPQTPGLHTAYLHITNNTTLTPDVVVTLTGRGSNAVPVVSATDPVHGFPKYTGDTNGVRLQPCLTSGDPNCVLLPDAGYNPGQPVVFPTNFPLEFFYGLADSQIITVSKATNNCGVGGTVQLRLALEGTFTTTSVQAGAQTFFGRWRITGKSLCPNTSYSFDTPWGTVSLTTNGAGAIVANQGTVDFPNPLVNAPAPVSNGGPLSTGFLRWDPQSATPPAGYLGDGRSFKPVIGAQYQLGGEPVNYFRIVGNGTNDKTTDFLVSGKLAGPVVTDVSSLSFGNQAQGTASATKTITYTNLSNDPVSNIAVTTSAPFSIVTDNCSGTTLATQDSTCTVLVALAPGIAAATGPVTGAVTITHNGLSATPAVTVTGTVTTPASAEMHVTPTSINFGSVNTGSTTTSSVTIANTGTAALTVNARGFGGVNAAEYSVTGGTCGLAVPINVAANSSCTLVVQFAPVGLGNRSATLTVGPSNASANATQTVSLVGTGLAAAVTVSPTSLSFSTKGSSSSVIKLTNTGTANLNLVGAPALVVEGKLPVASTGTFTTTHNCNNVAPGKSCNVSVTYTANNGPTNETTTATLRIKTNAANSTAGQPAGQFLVTLSGTRK